MTISELLLTAMHAAVEAGNQIIRIYQSDYFDVTSKADNTPVTKADIKSHEVLKKLLAHTKLPVISEEASNIPYGERSQWNSFWLVDPLDGTKEFIKRNNEFSVNIALMKNNYPVAGIIYSPYIHDLYFSAPGAGAYKININLQGIPKALSLYELQNMATRLHPVFAGKDITVITSKSHKSPDIKKYIANLEKAWPTVNIITKGSALKFGLIAEGIADVYPRFGPTMEWDVAAGHAIMSELGYKVVDVDSGNELTYNKPDLRNPWFIASNNRL